jgi:sulfide:quinone oxidoreductase
MKRLLIIGAGTAGTAVANRLRHRVTADWTVTVIDPAPDHLYQPALVFLPFNGQVEEGRIERPRRATLKAGVEWIEEAVEAIDPARRRVALENGSRLDYDLLVLATGSHIRPEETPGMIGDHWYDSVFDFYTLEGARRLRSALASFRGGRLAINVVEMPIKCPVAPLEFAFLADAYFTRRGIRDEVELVYVTPLDGAFTKPIAARMFGSILEERGIRVETEFNAGEVDGERRVLRSYDEREVPYDLLVTVPTHMGAALVEASGMGNELGFVPTEPGTLLAKGHEDIFVLGDATDLPTSKAGSVAHFQSHALVENILRAMHGKSLLESFDGHANCFVETGYGKAMLIDFNYDVEPLPGTYPLPWVGPMSLLKQTRRNHWGKLAFEWVYWNALLPGLPFPITNHMSMVGKKRLAA